MLSKEDMEILIYMNSDIWITPDVRRFKEDIMRRLDRRESEEQFMGVAHFMEGPIPEGDHRPDLSEALKMKVWRRAMVVPDYSPQLIRMDSKGFLMKYPEFGRTDSRFGWAMGPVFTEQGLEFDINMLHPFNLWHTMI